MTKLFYVLILALACSTSVYTSHKRVSDWWTKHSDSVWPARGDFDFYLNATQQLPGEEHPVVPAMLFALNLVLRNPEVTALSLMVLGFSLIHFLVAWCVYNATRTEWLAAAAFTFALSATGSFPFWGFLLKNVWAVVFSLACLTLILRVKDKPTVKILVAISTFAALTALSHSAPIWLLLEVLAVHAFHWTRNTEAKTRIVIPLLFCLLAASSVSVLAWTGRLRKLTNVFTLNTSTLLSNVGYLWFNKGAAIMLLVAAATTILTCLKRRCQPYLFGLLLAVSTAFFAPPSLAVWNRLYATAIPLLLVFFLTSVPILAAEVRG